MTVHARSVGAEELSALTQLARSRTRGAGLVRRAQIVLHGVEEGWGAPEIATRMGLSRKCVRFWLKRFNEQGLAGLHEAMRSGRPPPTPPKSAARWLPPP
ncbi:helix-turn-helix domain-containing protein [Azospirillum formosense]|uniref:helix-turn-helix domain-containing protein n=1 Tax=Azospirillum formosense TaxID=861533 RepID=UPI001B3B9344|nr:helix-turn-helix domain-containing protein [Azospirillum formosense]